MPVLLPGSQVFEIGKQGLGYLLSASSLGGTGAAPGYQASVCTGSWGGAVSYSGVIYVTCSNGLHALSLDAAAGTFSALPGWQVRASANGPPIVAGGLVWATDWNSGKLYGLKPLTGQPAVTQTTPAMAHFTTPSASDGKLFLATGQTVEAYTIANPAPQPAPGPVTTSAPAAPAKCTLRLRSNRVRIHHPRKPKHRGRASPALGTVGLIAKCDQNMSVTLRGLVTEVLGTKPKHGKAQTRSFHLASVRATVQAGVARTLRLRLAPALLRGLERRFRASAVFTLASGGATPAGARARLRL
jgi:hypothetical protein